jgi:hypothetical protein
MKNAHTLENVGKKNWQAQIDEETWLELTRCSSVWSIRSG